MHLYMSLIFNQTPTSFPYPLYPVEDVKIGQHPRSATGTLPFISCFCSSLPHIYLPYACSLNSGDKYYPYQNVFTEMTASVWWTGVNINETRNVYPVRKFKVPHSYSLQMYFSHHFTNLTGWSSSSYPKLNLEANIKLGLSAGQQPANWP